jgi:hypothetical protein
VLAYYPADDTAIVLLTNKDVVTGSLDAAIQQIHEILSTRP